MNKPLHVLLSAYACLPNAGTEPGNGWNWAIHLAERGIRVHVLTVTEGKGPIETYRAEHPNALISFSYVPVPRRFRHTTGMHYALWQWMAVKVARAAHRRSPFDLVHHVTYSSIHVPTQLWRIGLPTIFGPVGGGQVTPPSMIAAFGASRRTERLRTAFTKLLPYSLLHRRWLGKMKIVLATNTDTFRLVKAMGKGQVEPWFDAALPESFFAAQPRTFTDSPEAPLRLLWIGRMVPRKALPLTLDIMAAVRRPATLTLIGDGLPADEVRRMIADRGLTARVRWLGRLGRAAVRSAYLEHDALLFAGLRDSCPAQLLEAMALGVPVITLDHHGARDLVPEGTGIKVPVTDPKGVVRDMAAAVDDYADMSGNDKTAMSQAAWTFARTFSYTAGAEHFEMLYREILNGSSAPTSFPANARHMQAASGAR